MRIINVTHRFSRNVFALTMFFPIVDAFHAQYDPDGSTWYNPGPFSSYPQTNNDTPNGRTPLEQQKYINRHRRPCISKCCTCSSCPPLSSSFTDLLLFSTQSTNFSQVQTILTHSV